MFFWKKKTDGRVYSGEVFVVPRSGIRKFVSSLAPALDQRVDGVVEDTLLQLLDCPPKSLRKNAKPTDLALDVVVPEYDYGQFLFPQLGGYFVPLIWRPHITITGRLYVIDTGETISKATVKHSVSWSLWGKTALSVPKLLRIKSNMSDADMDRLTTEAFVKLLSKM